jgi:hypothetical protein
VHGSYRCMAKNSFGETSFTIEFQSPGLPDPVTEFQATNITDTSFVLHWHAGYDGGSEQFFHLVLRGNHTEEKRQTKFNSIGFRDLQENTAYQVVLRSRNNLGYSPNTTSVVIRTRPSSVRVEEIPIVERAYYLIDRRRLGFQLKDDRRAPLAIDAFCLQYYDTNSDDESLPCTPLRSIRVSDREFEVDIETMNLRLKLCFINESEICSRSLSVPTGLAVVANSSDWILILIGKIFALVNQCSSSFALVSFRCHTRLVPCDCPVGSMSLSRSSTTKRQIEEWIYRYTEDDLRSIELDLSSCQ